MRKVKVGVIGVGAWGKNHVRVLKELNDSELVMICDVAEERVKLIAKRYGVKWTTDYIKLLENKDIDAVTICTPASKHAEIAIDAISYGKHVLVEKPMSGEVEKAREIVRRAKRKGVYLSVGFIERFNPGVLRIKEALSSGEIGEVVLISSKRVSRWPERIEDVGVLKDTVIHDIDLFRFILNSEPRETYAKVGSIKHRYEDYAEILLCFNEARVGFIEANWLTPRKVRKLSITGTEGILHLDYLTQEVLVEKIEGVFIPSFKWEEPLKRELEAFLNAIINDETPPVSGEDGVKALEIIEAILKSSREGRPIKI